MASMDEINDMTEGVELPDELMEAISGGELNPMNQWLLDGMIKSYKLKGKSLDDFTAFVQGMGEGHYEFRNNIRKWRDGMSADQIAEIIAYAKQNW